MPGEDGFRMAGEASCWSLRTFTSRFERFNYYGWFYDDVPVVLWMRWPAIKSWSTGWIRNFRRTGLKMKPNVWCRVEKPGCIQASWGMTRISGGWSWDPSGCLRPRGTSEDSAGISCQASTIQEVLLGVCRDLQRCPLGLTKVTKDITFSHCLVCVSSFSRPLKVKILKLHIYMFFLNFSKISRKTTTRKKSNRKPAARALKNFREVTTAVAQWQMLGDLSERSARRGVDQWLIVSFWKTILMFLPKVRGGLVLF